MPDLPPHLVAIGLWPIHRACLDGDLEQVKELCEGEGEGLPNLDIPVVPRIQQPLDEAAAWPNGETPLMLAALMGHFEIFEYLVQKGAGYKAKDGDGLPIPFYCTSEGGDFAADKRAFWRAQGVGKEHPRAHYTRAAIVDLLDHPTRLYMLTPNIADAGYPDIYLGKEGTKIKLFVNIDTVNTGETLSAIKTIGCIKARDGHRVLKVAASGFKDRAGPLRRDPRVLDRGALNDLALNKVARIIGFRFSANFNDNGNRLPLPHHRGRVHAGHVEVQLTIWYVLEMANRLAADPLTAPAGGSGQRWTTKQKLRNLKNRIARLGSDREAVLCLSAYPCASCLKFIQALTSYTGVLFYLRGGFGVGPVAREKIGRNNAAIDQVQKEFEDLDAGPDPSDDDGLSSDGSDGDGDLESGVVPSSIPRPAVAAGANFRQDMFVPMTPEIINSFNTAQEPIVIDDDSASEEEEEETANTAARYPALGAETSQQTTPATLQSAAFPSTPDHGFHYTPMGFVPQLERPRAAAASVQTFREKIGEYRHVPPARPRPAVLRPRTYEERMRYRNPWPAPVLVPPPYLSAHHHHRRRPLAEEQAPYHAAATHRSGDGVSITETDDIGMRMGFLKSDLEDMGLEIET